MDLTKFIKFEALITPALITIVYLLGILLIVLVSLPIMAMSFAPPPTYMSFTQPPPYDGFRENCVGSGCSGSSFGTNSLYTNYMTNKSAPSFDGMYIVWGLVFLVFGNVIWRMVCEFIVVLFKINDNISSVNSHFIAMKQNP